MIIEDGKFYFIKDKFFDIFKDYKLMENKKGGNKRGCRNTFSSKKRNYNYCIKSCETCRRRHTYSIL